MRHATIFMLERLSETRAIWDALNAFDDDVLGPLDSALEEHVPAWLGAEWSRSPDANLEDDEIIRFHRENWSLEGADGEVTQLVRVSLWLDGAEALWPLLGLPSEDSKACLSIAFQGLFELPNGDKAHEAFKAQFRKHWEGLGWKRAGGKTDARMDLPIALSPPALIKALSEDDWEDALQPIREALTRAMGAKQQEIDAFLANARRR